MKQPKTIDTKFLRQLLRELNKARPAGRSAKEYSIFCAYLEREILTVTLRAIEEDTAIDPRGCAKEALRAMSFNPATSSKRADPDD